MAGENNTAQGTQAAESAGEKYHSQGGQGAGEKYHSRLCGLFGEEALEGKVRERISAFCGLLTRDAALYLLAKEAGIAKEEMQKIAQIKQWMKRVSTQGRLARIFPLQKYEKNGIVKKSVRALLFDESGEVTLLLWGRQAQRLFGEIGMGDLVRVENAYITREGELSLGAEGRMECVQHAPLGKIGQLEEGVRSMEGQVKEIFPDYYYMRGSEERKMCSFLLAQGGKEVRVVVWGLPQRVKELEEGGPVRLENALYKNNELQVGELGRIIALGKEENGGFVQGEMKEIALAEDGFAVRIGGREVFFDASLAHAALGLKFIPEGVSLETALALKKKSLLGSKVRIRVEEREGKLVALSVEEGD